MSNVKKEQELYEPMSKWLNDYLVDNNKSKNCDIRVVSSSTQYLDKILTENDIIKYYPKVVGLQIQIDVLGMVIFNNSADLYFIEAKKTRLNIQNLGQMLMYCKLCNPKEAYLLSSAGMGTLDKVLKNLNRLDLLDYGDNKVLKRIHVSKWDVSRNCIDSHAIIPKK